LKAGTLVQVRPIPINGIVLKFTLITLVTACAVFGANYFGSYYALRQTINNYALTTIGTTSRLLNVAVSPAVTFAAKGVDSATVQAFVQEMISSNSATGISYVVVGSQDGSIVFSIGLPNQVVPQYNAPLDYEDATLRGMVHVRDPILLRSNEVGFLQYGLATSDVVNNLTGGYRKSLISTTAVLLWICLVPMVLGLMATRRVARLSYATKDIALGNYSMRVDAKGRDEIAALSRNFNRMASAIEQKMQEVLILNQELEQRVQKGTQDLRVSNQQLVTQIEQLEAAKEHLSKTEKLASLGSLVAGIAHELNTPIGNALTVTTATTHNTQEFGKQFATGKMSKAAFHAFLQTVIEGNRITEQALTKAAKLISEFKQVAVDQTSERRRSFDLAETIGEIITTLKFSIKEGQHRILCQVPDGILIEGYPGPLGQVITNLVNNSLVHAFSGSTSDGEIRITAVQKSASRVTIEFSDNGCGIAAQYIARVFDPFFTTRLGHGGSGLGLNIAHNIVETLLGGTIDVHSELGKGATFIVDLPLVAPWRAEQTGG
jgi:signal transduction histidine kinase